MTKPHQEDQAEPFFITEEVEAELIAAGHVFEPPGHVSTKHVPEILASLTGVLASIAKSDDADSTPPLAFDGIFHGIDD